MRKVTETICQEVNSSRIVIAMNYLYEGHNDINQCWTYSSNAQHASLKSTDKDTRPEGKYDMSASADARRTHDERIKNSTPKLLLKYNFLYKKYGYTYYFRYIINLVFE